MSADKADDGSKKVKNIAAVVYLAVLLFLVGGSYIDQQHGDASRQATSSSPKP